MTSEIRTNNLKSRAGLSTVTLSDTGPVVTGIATFGVTTKIDGNNNVINVGTALTIGHTQGVQFHTQNLHSTGFEVNQVNASGIITASSYRGDGSQLTGISAGFSQDAQGNLVAGTNAGSSLDGSSAEYNILLGEGAGESIDGDDNNIAIGHDAGKNNTASSNIFIGKDAAKTLNSSLSSQNVFIGHEAVYNKANISGTVVGAQAGLGNGTGINLTLFGYRAGGNSYNSTTFVGHQAGRFATSGCDFTTSVGANSLAYNEGTGNVAIGNLSGQVLTSGEFNTLAGYKAGRGGLSGTINYTDCVAIGSSAAMNLSSANNVIVIGANANPSSNTVTNEITLGNTNHTKFRIPGLNYVNDAGKVGINTTSPTLNGNEEGIHIVSEDYPTLHLTNSTTGHAANNGSMFTLNDTGETIIRNGHASHIRFDTNNGSSIGERLRIESNGNALFTANQVKLYNATDNTNTYFYAQNTGAGNAGIKLKNSQGEWTIIANDRLRFIDDDAGLERVSIRSDGDAYFSNAIFFSGANSSPNNNDWGRLNVVSGNVYGTSIEHNTNVVLTNEQGQTTQAMVLGDTSGGTNGKVLWGVSINASTNNPTTGSESGWSEKARVEGNGDFVISGSYTPSGSDDRLKKNKVGITSALSKVCAMEGFTFEWNDVADKIGMSDGDRHFGLSAQTVEPLAPEVVVVNDMLVNPDDGTNDYKTIRYDRLVPMLVEAIKDLKTKNDELKSRISALETDNIVLRTRVTNLEGN